MINQQRWLLGAIGAGLGAVLLIGAGEFIRPAELHAQAPVAPPPSNSMGPITGNQGIITQGQNGNNVIFQTPKRALSDQDKSQLLASIPKSRKIVIVAVPDGAALDFAEVLYSFLVGNGYSVAEIEKPLMISGPNGPPRGNNINTPPDITQPVQITVGY